MANQARCVIVSMLSSPKDDDSDPIWPSLSSWQVRVPMRLKRLMSAPKFGCSTRTICPSRNLERVRAVKVRAITKSPSASVGSMLRPRTRNRRIGTRSEDRVDGLERRLVRAHSALGFDAFGVPEHLCELIAQLDELQRIVA